MSLALAWLVGPVGRWVVLGAVLLGLAAAAVLFVERIRGKGEEAGAAAVTTKVQAETIKALDAARRNKERADEDARTAPLDDLIDRLR